MDAHELLLHINKIGLLQQTIVAFLFMFLFLLLNSNKKLATRQLFLSWFWLSISLVSLFVQNKTAFNLNSVSTMSSTENLISNSFYQTGKGFFFIYLFSSVQSLCDIPEKMFRLKPQHLLWGWTGLTLATVFSSLNINSYIIIQAPVAICLLGLAGYLLNKHYPGVGIGCKVVPIIFYLNMLMWFFYLLRFLDYFDASFQFQEGLIQKLTANNSFLALLGEMLLAFAMLIVIFEKYSKILKLANGQLEQFNSTLNKDTYLDSLTGAQNRRALEFHYKNMNFTNNKGATLVVCDVGNLKRVNDNLGYAYGDQLLITFVEHIKDSLREGDKIYRTGGDVFVIWMQSCTFILANNRFEKLLANTPDIEKQLKGYSLNFSYGCAMIRAKSQLDEVISEASQLMHQKKSQ